MAPHNPPDFDLRTRVRNPRYAVRAEPGGSTGARAVIRRVPSRAENLSPATAIPVVRVEGE